MQNKPKKNLYGIIFLVIMLSFIISLTGCDWFSNGLFNIFDPKAQIIAEFNPVEGGEPAAGCCNAGASCINGVEFFITGFAYNYHGVDYVDGKIAISELSRVLEASFYVAPSTSPGTPGPKTIIENIPLFFQDVVDYLYLHPFITEITCDLSLVGVDGAGHSLSFQVASGLPIFEPGIDLYPPTAVITTTPVAVNGSLTDSAPFSVVFDASGSYDFIIDLEGNIINIGSGIASINWDFGDESTETDIIVEHTYDSSGIYIVTLTVTDLYGNQGYKTMVITVTEPEIEITVRANPVLIVPGGASTITAVVTDKDTEEFVSDGTTVYFHTNSGTLSVGSATTTNGIATVTLDNMQDGEEATVTAFIGAVSNFVKVKCTEEIGPEVEITVSSNPESNVPGGTSIISAIVTYEGGDVVPDGTTVYFYTNSGTLSADSADTANGIATVNLTLDDNMLNGQTATVTAFIGSKEGTAVVTCIDIIITIYADDYSIAPAGNTTITAIVTDPEGVPVDNVIVIFFTDIGTLNPIYYTTGTVVSGIATTTLTLDTAGDVAHVTARCGSRVSNEITITCE